MITNPRDRYVHEVYLHLHSRPIGETTCCSYSLPGDEPWDKERVALRTQQRLEQNLLIKERKLQEEQKRKETRKIASSLGMSVMRYNAILKKQKQEKQHSVGIIGKTFMYFEGHHRYIGRFIGFKGGQAMMEWKGQTRYTDWDNLKIENLYETR